MLVGTYDASTFVDGNYATYPQLPPGAVYYQPSMWWDVTVAGTVQGQAVLVGDKLFATLGAGRLYGQHTYGDLIYGGLSQADWHVAHVQFQRWNGQGAPLDLDPYPNAGCPFTTADNNPDGDWAPGWRIVVEWWGNNLVGTRTYGQLTYGAQVYGDSSGLGKAQWNDITRPSFRIETGDGTREGTQHVVVSEIDVELYDDDGVWLDFADPWIWYQPQPGTPLRVGLLDPNHRYHPIIVGEIERIEDVHDDAHPRVVSVRAFGHVMDLVVDVIAHQRATEMASVRFRDLVTQAGWRWGWGPLTFPGDTRLVDEIEPRDIVIRDELDRIVQSAGWFMDQDRRGYLRVRRWPHDPTGVPLYVVDCIHPGDPSTALVSPSIVFVNDESQLLNWVLTTNSADPEVEVRGESSTSIGRFGKRGRALGYPKTNLSFSDRNHAVDWVRRITNRFSHILRHVEQVEADTAVDQAWLPVLADMDTGRALNVHRHEPHELVLDNIVVGWRHTIEPGHWQSVLFTTTTTASY